MKNLLLKLRLKERWQWCALIGVATLLTAYYEPTPKLVSLTGSTMGTYYQVKYLNQPRLPTATAIQSTIEQHLERVNALMSTYRADSELSQFNQSQVVDQPFPLAPETLIVIREAVRLHQLSEGALDITLGPLVNLWGFGPLPATTERVPSASDLAQQRAWSGMDKLSVTPEGVIKHVPQLSLDLSGIAKGFGVDQLADYLTSLGIHHFLINIGGEIRLKGHNQQQRPWRIAIENPTDFQQTNPQQTDPQQTDPQQTDPQQTDSQQSVQQLITPGNQALATSGDYRNYFEKAGVRYSHTLDPRTGSPITHNLVSVTVLHPSCMTADGLATALNVLGLEKALSIANQWQIPVLMLIKTPEGFTQRYSEAFKPYLNAQEEPS